MVAWHDRYARLLHDLLRNTLRSHASYRRWGRTNEGHSFVCKSLGEIGVFRKETITRVDSLSACLLDHFEVMIDYQVRILRLGFSNQIRIVAQLSVLRVLVGL